MASNKTFFVAGIGNQDKFDNLTLLLSDYELHKLISSLSEAMTHYHNQEPPSRICVTLHGALKDDCDVRSISFVQEAK